MELYYGIYCGIILRNDIMELYYGNFMKRIPGMPGTFPEPPLGSRGSPGPDPEIPGDAPGPPGHAPGTPG